jgi:transketolase
MEMVAVDDQFGESGTPEQLMKKYGLDAPHIILAAEKAMQRKNESTKVALKNKVLTY